MKLLSLILAVSLTAYYAAILVDRYLAYPGRLSAVYEAEYMRDAAYKFIRDQCVETGSESWNSVTSAAVLVEQGYLSANPFGGVESTATGIRWQVLQANRNFILIQALSIPDIKTLQLLSTRFPSITTFPALNGNSSAQIAMPVSDTKAKLLDHQAFLQSEFTFQCNI